MNDANTSIPKCACGCGQPIKRDGSRGPAPRYASNACKTRAYRDRTATDQLEPIDGDRVAVPVKVTRLSPDKALEQVLLQLRTCVYSLSYLSTVTRPEFSWRCSELSQKTEQAIEDTFGRNFHE